MNRNDLLKSGIKRMTQILLSLLMISVPLLGQSKSTFIKQFEYDDENGPWGNPMVVNDSILIVAYSGYKGFGNVQTLKIAADGSTISKVALLRFDDDDAYDEFSHWFIAKDNSPEEQVSENELKELLKDALKNVEEKEALVIQLYFVEELNIYEIAEVLSVSTGRVSQIKSNAIKKIRNFIDKNLQN